MDVGIGVICVWQFMSKGMVWVLRFNLFVFNTFSVMSGQSLRFLGITSTFGE